VEWTLFTLAFILGYITCKTFYFYKAARVSIVALKATHVTCLALLVKALEDFYYAKVYRMQKMVESGETDHNITAFSYLMEEEISHYKRKAVKTLIEYHPDFFKQVIEFEDWNSAMTFLETHKDLAAQFLTRSKND
jgi:hypothetical protein|tara:strand:+ start:83 stop:490 length:408 start_codon:yes stop_codon:yes gene_type:complete